MSKVFGLIDCNSFFASCERVFNPQLAKRPVIVLSNNDGCVIARTAEAKALGIKMGQPFFEIKHLAHQHKVYVASTNFTLYGDISERVMQTIAYFTDDLEIYSIDEAFIDVTKIRKSDLTAFGREIKQTIAQWTGIPVSVGFGPTKTLAKAANELAKTNPDYHGVLTIQPQEIDQALTQLDVADVWGIGRQYTKFLYSQGIRTALQLKNVRYDWLKANANINFIRTVMELQGTACIHLEQARISQKSVLCSRTFKSPVTDLNQLKSLISSYVARAAEKLRQEKVEAKNLNIFIQTSRFDSKSYYTNSAGVKLPQSTASTLELINFAHTALEKIFLPERQYKRAGVLLLDFAPAQSKQLNLFSGLKKTRHSRLMEHIDQINTKWGRSMIHSASETFNGIQFMRQNYISPRYTSQWDELPLVKA